MYLSVFLCKYYAINKTGNSANCQSCYSNIGITPDLNDAFESWDSENSLAMSSFPCHIMTWTLDQSWSPSVHESNQKFSKKAGLEVTFLGSSLWPSVICICVLDPAVFLSCHLPTETSHSRVCYVADWIEAALSYLGHRSTLTTGVIWACKLSQ